jgi:hypothetical protein
MLDDKKIMDTACKLHDSFYTIQVQQKGFENWHYLETAKSLDEVENLIAKINYDCNVRIIHVTKNIVETRKITKGTPLDRKALFDLIKDMPVLSVVSSNSKSVPVTSNDAFGTIPTGYAVAIPTGIFYNVVGIESCRVDSHSHNRCETFTLRDIQTHITLVCVFDGAAIVGDKLKVFTRDGAEVQFNVLKPVKLN